VGPDVVLDDKGKISIRNPKEFFDFDSKNFQFTGRVSVDVIFSNQNVLSKIFSTNRQL
jgi:hypothetical protein